MHIEGYICIDKDNIKIKLCKIEYIEYDENNFKYIFTPYYKNIDLLDENQFCGIQGINLEQRRDQYIRENFVPTFISERSPIKSRTNLSELMGKEGLKTYYPLQWLKKTKMRYFGDNLYVSD